MNSLELHIRSKNLNEIDLMNALQENGIVSDLAVFACDVAESDCTAAIAFLTFRGITPKRQEAEQIEMPLTRQARME